MKVSLKSVYFPCDLTDGPRYLVETLWPEGVDVYELSPYFWVRELAPSYELKETALWKHWDSETFRREYQKELQMPERASWLSRMAAEACETGITLLHRSRKRESDILPNDTSAYYLKEFLHEAAREHLKLSSKPMNQDTEKWVNEGGR